MEYKEFEEKLGKKIKIGDRVWICDYRYNNIGEKPIRHVTPQEVIIVSNENLPKNKNVYYAKVHFRPIGKSGNPTSKIIAPYDNTGYRLYTGVSINIFFNEVDCRKFYKEQCDKIEEDIKFAREKYNAMFDKMLEDLKNEIKENC